MRCLLIASILAGIVGSVQGHRAPVTARKSLGFGPVHPHAVYRSNPYQIATNGVLPQSPDADPFEVARLFIGDILGPNQDQASYKIRPDSYTDPSTGVTHVYVRQYVHGIEVADGNMNINVKEGKILSYGNSFFAGTPPSLIAVPDSRNFRHPQREYCQDLSVELETQFNVFASTQNEQAPMDDQKTSKFAAFAGPLTHLYYSNCQFDGLADDMALKRPQAIEDIGDMRPALLQFMVAATPKAHVVNDILGNYDEHLNKMSVSGVNHFTPEGEQTYLFVDNVPDTVNPVKANIAYIQIPSEDGSVELVTVWKFEVEMQDNWYEAAVSAIAPHRIISVVDWASDAPVPVPDAPKEPASYNVFAWGVNDPSEGNRTLQKENFDNLASPIGWHSLPFANDPSYRGVKPSNEFYRNTSTTFGNNVFAQENWEGQNAYINNYRPDAGSSSVYDFQYKPKVSDSDEAMAVAHNYINATVTQLFYTSNMIHDLYYRYGFTEVAGNFQQYNFGRGGREGDAVIANAQDGSGFNNANFMTPPDGTNGRMRMYLWNTANPYRDGDFEAGIVIHEYSHGLSTRLTGGPLNSGCLGWGESGGMGEGWGDFLATTIRSTANYSDYPMGAWAANRPKGIRNYPYSLNETVNPSTYQTLDKPGYWGVHAIGEVWAQILWLVSQALIEEHGFSDTLYPPMPLENGTVPANDFYRPAVGKKPLVPKHGNTLSVQLVINGMKLQPCQPSFFDARDAIILADEELTGGENFCTLWKAFSLRGLGTDASVQGRTPWGGGIRLNGFATPTTCE
ncbi:extracellular elastinolytic metallo proteinase [Lentinula edodes]|uniref:extracellular elastinolytic metallo proteinase n=1 Tax=Lentinula edodes TaxID=5353 RepID=UPI001E8E78CC|nr:extracellular elastinolytic metallo proteinase [Lentinula edodes]KAH7879431.1 extracellular elastinolytic metallo proteinase [Lentinula edodes]